MRLLILSLVSVWSCIYVGSMSVALWKARQWRGAVGTGILAVVTLVAPPLIHLYTRTR